MKPDLPFAVSTLLNPGNSLRARPADITWARALAAQRTGNRTVTTRQERSAPAMTALEDSETAGCPAGGAR